MRDGRPKPSGSATSQGIDDEGSSVPDESNDEELASLRTFLHFPEEVALRLTDTEYQLFYQVAPIDYLRQVTFDLGGEGVLGAVTERHMIRRAPPTHTQQSKSTVRALIRRFNQVSRIGRTITYIHKPSVKLVKEQNIQIVEFPDRNMSSWQNIQFAECPVRKMSS
ncbi:unnamed protein product [Arctia plantaginis]|uniref:Uncharacterized protein n=1 Tax=Arctia plantaginis TaxID=874455 RepID=A0A8S0YWU5_ARCPL|nr:unnamed protein product [Arctia plantaginis]